jgi:uncharacterized SAM-binding protein YcdF (DUF218 family)
MFFILSKLVWFVAAPVNFLVLLSLLGLCLWLLGSTQVGRSLTATGIILLAAGCFSPLGPALMRPLEDRFPLPPQDFPAPTGIIVLGGALNEEMTQARGEPTLIEGAERLTKGVELARRYPSSRLIFTGGTANLSGRLESEATGVKELWRAMGVPETQMSFETESRNTWENGVLTRDLVKPKPGDTWLLVTSAWHMPRSMGIFRQLGFNVTPYPVHFMTLDDSRDWWPAPDVLGHLTMLTYAIHEWIGLTAYRLTGKTDALFPAPDVTK